MTKKSPSTAGIVLRHALGPKWFASILAVVAALAPGAILIVMAGASVSKTYYAMFRGTIFDPEASSLQRQIKSVMNSFFYAIPLIIGGLGLGFGFRAGLFSIGGQGQVIFGALAAVWVGFSLHLPPILHTILALLAVITTGTLYAGIAGLLEARIGANEVIITIMLNSIAGLALGYVLAQKAWQVPGSNQPQTPVVADTAAFAPLLPNPFKLYAGLIVAVIAVVVSWWVLDRSASGFEVKIVGANPDAARTVGISVGRITTITMMIFNAFFGLAGASEALGTIGYVPRDVAGSIGSDAIAVALLGRSKPVGTFFAGLFFGAFRAGGCVMQPKGVPIDMTLILQSVIVLLIAVPVLVCWLFHLPRGSKKPLRAQLAALVQTPASVTAQSQASERASAAKTSTTGAGDEAVNPTTSRKEGDAQ